MDRASPQTARSYERKSFKTLGSTREGGRADGSTLALPIGLSIRKFPLGHLSKARLRLRDSKGCSFIPSRSEISEETRRSFYFPQRRGIVHTWLAALALARARKLERVRVGQCRSGGIQNNKILPENGHFHKLIVTAEGEPNTFIINGLCSSWNRISKP